MRNDSTCPCPKDVRGRKKGSMPFSKPTRQTPSMGDQEVPSIYSAQPSPVEATGCPQSWQSLAVSVLATMALVSFRGWLKCSSELRIKFKGDQKGLSLLYPFPSFFPHIRKHLLIKKMTHFLQRAEAE